MQEDASNAAPLPQRVIPLPWEDLPSVISRVARKMGYERPEWILRAEAFSHRIAPNALPLLRRQADYQLLKRQLLLEEEQLFSLTLHRFAHRFEALASPLSQTDPDFLASIERMLPRHVQFFRSEPETQVCPLCLDKPDGYDRLYWRCSYVLLCARHRIYLVDHCPVCRAPIPGLRIHPMRCPSCHVGDYRTNIVPLLEEDDWLEASQSLLLGQLGVERAEIGGRVRTDTTSPLQQIPSWDYFWILSQFTQLFEVPAFGYILPFLSRTLPLQALLARVPSTVLHPSYLLFQLVLLHYLLAVWPAHVPVLLEQLQRALQDVFHYPEASGLLRRWKRALVERNCWCLSAYLEQPRVALQSLFTACSLHIEQLHPLTITEHSVEHGVNVVNRLLEPFPQRPTEQECVVPRPWEDLASVISRVARNRGDEFADWVLRFHDSSYRLSADTIPVVTHHADYQFLGHLLRLDEAMLYQLTLHRLAAALQPPGSTIRQRARFAATLDIEWPLLSATVQERFCLPLTTTRVCPACLDEHDGYDRLYWQLRLVLICPRHALFLIDRCPRCALPIPALRLSLTACPHCRTGDYRTARRWLLSSDTLLSTGELFLLHRLGVDQVIGQGSSSPFAHSPLSTLESWQYFQLLDLFGSVYRHLLPDRLFAYVGWKMGLHDVHASPVPLEVKALAKQISLFHALFISWPQQCLVLMEVLEQIVHERIGAPGTHERIWRPEVIFGSSGSGQEDHGEIFVALQQVFENFVRYAQASVLTQQRSDLLIPARRSFLRNVQTSLPQEQARS
ncbi:MAG: TniQ family protein [Ktedonobacteraceae bacterium]